MTAREVFDQSNGDVTRAYYDALGKLGVRGRLAVALFRAQKTSTRAKRYSRRYRGAAYDVKSWSMGQCCEVLMAHPDLVAAWGWKPDPSVPFGDAPSWVLYIELPNGQVSFHSPKRGAGPDFAGEWDGSHASERLILEYCDQVATEQGVLS